MWTTEAAVSDRTAMVWTDPTPGTPDAWTGKDRSYRGPGAFSHIGDNGRINTLPSSKLDRNELRPLYKPITKHNFRLFN